MSTDHGFEMAIGSLESQEKGSAARANGGKPDWSLMPLRQIALLLRCCPDVPGPYRESLSQLVIDAAQVQETGRFDDAFNWLLHTTKFLANELDTSFEGALIETIAVWEYGKKKYAAFNWMKGMVWSQTIASYMRHIWDLARGEMHDQESGRHHGAHLVCNAMMLVHFMQHYKDGNDLPTQWFN